MNSRTLERKTALPSANLEYGVIPAPFSCNSYRILVEGLVDSKREIALCAGPVSRAADDDKSSIPHHQADPPTIHCLGLALTDMTQSWVHSLQLPACNAISLDSWKQSTLAHRHNIVPMDISPLHLCHSKISCCRPRGLETLQSSLHRRSNQCFATQHD